MDVMRYVLQRCAMDLFLPDGKLSPIELSASDDFILAMARCGKEIPYELDAA